MFEGSIYTYATLEWQGRELSKITVFQQGSAVPVVVISYTYNDQGYRTSKKIDKITQGSLTIFYTLDNDRVIYETDGTYAIIYTYDYDGKLIGFTYDPNVNITSNEEDYFFLRNQLGDISHILNANGITVVHYVYDAYGNIIKTDVTSGYAHIAAINSYTYRGYRYDSEIGMYYLNSRYYNPEIGRFINSDGLLGLEGDILTTNMYAYAVNNPIMNIDPSGFIRMSVLAFAVIADFILVIIGAIATVIAGQKAWKVLSVFKSMKKAANKVLYKISEFIAKSLGYIVKLGVGFNGATIKWTAARIFGIISPIVLLSPGYLIARIIDNFDSNPNDGYVDL